MYTIKNKGKIFISAIAIFIVLIITGIVILSYRIISDSQLNNITNDLSIAKIFGESTSKEVSIEKTEAVVIDVIDGDTVKVIQNGEKKTVRLIGIDAPEVKEKECMYSESTDYLSKLVLNKTVELQSDPTQTDVDKYYRDLRYIYLGGLNVNRRMIQRGMAKEYTYKEPYIYHDSFVQAEEVARISALGIWSNECIANQ